MNILHKFSHNLPNFSSKFGLHIDAHPEYNDATKSVQRHAMRLLDSFSSEAIKTDAMIQIGHTAFMGGKLATRAAVKWCPLFIEMLKNPKYSGNVSMQVACLQALCEICHDDRKAQEFIMFNRDHHKLLRDMIGNTSTLKRVRIGRWACYLLVMCTAGNVKTLNEIVQDKELEEALIVCADNNKPDWQPWGMNLADLALKLLNLRDPAEPVANI